MSKPPKSPRTKPLLREDVGPLKSRRLRRRDPAQPQLLFDPMPERVEPCLATLLTRPPTTGDWSWEIKWDGYRVSVFIDSNGAKILTRGGHDWTDRFPLIAQGARDLGPTTMILDGEAVKLDDQGRSDFGLLQKSLGATGKRDGNKASDAVFMAFDLLYLDGHDLRGMEYSTRRHLLEDALGNTPGPIRVSEEIEADPNVLLEHACSLGLEGIIGKHRDRPYRSGRNGDWVKIKCVSSDAFFIVGYEPSPGTAAFRSLLLGAYRGDEIVYVGSVGTGFKSRQATELRKLMDTVRWKEKRPPVAYDGGGKDIVWLHPTLIAEIEYRAWTDDSRLRHAAYKGLRERQDNADVFKIK
ncbi:non-homologous end-joining DNA ligase [Pararhizobium arenae]|uniref:non-homologous end-joining DNA ligase n=1 Tax=Pararhizobium arenae TaxID=1856850 RepID=UPI00094B6377|nr:non-homologous end-joining DNA ligase [Pararhizobium arenae]